MNKLHEGYNRNFVNSQCRENIGSESNDELKSVPEFEKEGEKSGRG